MKQFEKNVLEEAPTKFIKHYFLNPYETNLEFSILEEEEIPTSFGTGPHCLK